MDIKNKNILDKFSKSSKLSKHNQLISTSFLRTIESSQINKLNSNSENNNQQKDVDEIVLKYLNLKNKLNILWNKAD